MIFQRVNRDDAEKVFLIGYNVAGATITANYPASWDVGTADGIRVTQPVSATLSLFVGLANKDIVDSAYGLFQAYGYRASGYMLPSSTTAFAAGNILVPVNALWSLAYSGASDGKSGFIYAGEAVTTMTTPVAKTAKVFIRAL